MITVAQLCEYMKKPRLVHLKQVNWMGSELYINKAVTKFLKFKLSKYQMKLLILLINCLVRKACYLTAREQ